MKPRSRRVLATVLAGVALTACNGGSRGGEVETQAPESIDVTSSAFASDERIPATYTCVGRDISPPLSWTGAPAQARELALVVDDPDAPGGTYTHWILVGLPPSMSSLDEGSVPPNAKQAKNSDGRAGYAGPCPPSGTHHYRFTVYALDAPLDLGNAADTGDALAAIGRHAIAQGRLVGVVTAD